MLGFGRLIGVTLIVPVQTVQTGCAAKKIDHGPFDFHFSRFAISHLPSDAILQDLTPRFSAANQRGPRDLFLRPRKQITLTPFIP